MVSVASRVSSWREKCLVPDAAMVCRDYRVLWSVKRSLPLAMGSPRVAIMMARPRLCSHVQIAEMVFAMRWKIVATALRTASLAEVGRRARKIGSTPVIRGNGKLSIRLRFGVVEN